MNKIARKWKEGISNKKIYKNQNIFEKNMREYTLNMHTVELYNLFKSIKKHVKNSQKHFTNKKYIHIIKVDFFFFFQKI